MPRCSSCGAEITWVITSDGRQLPMDAAEINVTPAATGGKRILTIFGEWISGRQVGDAYEYGYHMGFTCHFDTCRNRRTK